MSSAPKKYKVYKCARCPDRRFDVLKISKSVKSRARCFENHVKETHPDHAGDWSNLIGEIITVERGQKAGNQQKKSTNPMPAHSPALPSARTPTSNVAQDTEALVETEAFRQGLINAYDPSIDYNIRALAQHAKHTATTIKTRMQNGQSVKIALCSWDQAAIEGKLEDEIVRLAKEAFPFQIIDFHNGVCSTSHGETGERMVRFYTKKAEKFESRAGDRVIHA